MSKKVAFYTLGCKLNFAETSSVGLQFLKNGFEIEDFNSKADVYLINTCSVTDNADKECRRIVRRAMRNNPNAYIIVTGCYAQLRPGEVSSIPGVDLVLGSNEKFDVFDFARDFIKSDVSCIYTAPVEGNSKFRAASSSDADSRTRAFLKVQDGCDFPCTYCTIPKARGASRSENPENVLIQAEQLIKEGYREIILTGVNVGDYGKNSEFDLASLLKSLVRINGDFRIRISSIEPNLVTDEIITLVKNEEKLARHFHIPLQSGSTEILKLMKRRYNKNLYIDRVHKIAEEIPDAGIGADVISGFPGETEEHFAETYEFVDSLPLSYLHAFSYSERPGTPAIEYPGSVDPAERRNRTNRLRDLGEGKKLGFHSRFVNSNLRVLFESSHDDGIIKGFSSNYVRVAHRYSTGLENSYFDARIKGADAMGAYTEEYYLSDINQLVIKAG